MTVPLSVDADVIVLVTRLHLHRQPWSQSFLQPHFMTSRNALGVLQGALPMLFSIHRLFWSPNRWRLQGWAVSFGGTWFGPIHGHLDTLLFEGYFLSEASFHSRMFPSVMFPSLVVLSYKSTLCESIILCINCASVDWQFIEWLCYLRIHSPNRQYSFSLRFPAKADILPHPVN